MPLDACGIIVYAGMVRAAFKEWAIVVDSLGRGEQIIILRKGGLHEGRGGFQASHSSFFLFPTLFHQQRESVLPAAQRRFDELVPHFPAPDKLRLEFFAEIADTINLNSLDDALALRGQHIWRDEVIAQRFDWSREKSIYALAVRVFRLAEPLDLHMRPDYSGCKSWIQLEWDVSEKDSSPVLADAEFTAKLGQFRDALKHPLPAP